MRPHISDGPLSGAAAGMVLSAGLIVGEGRWSRTMNDFDLMEAHLWAASGAVGTVEGAGPTSL